MYSAFSAFLRQWLLQTRRSGSFASCEKKRCLSCGKLNVGAWRHATANPIHGLARRRPAGASLLATAAQPAGPPPMGWNSWNWFGKQEINEGIVQGVIDALK